MFISGRGALYIISTNSSYAATYQCRVNIVGVGQIRTSRLYNLVVDTSHSKFILLDKVVMATNIGLHLRLYLLLILVLRKTQPMFTDDICFVLNSGCLLLLELGLTLLQFISILYILLYLLATSLCRFHTHWTYCTQWIS